MLWSRGIRLAGSVAGLVAIALFGQSHGAAALQSSHPAHLKLVQPNVLSVGSDTTYPPMEASDVSHPGHFVGADVDLAAALAKAMGLGGSRIVSTSFDSIIPALQRHNFDIIMSSMNDTPDRRKQINFVDYMQLRAAEAILVPKASALHAGAYRGLCGHSIAVEKGTAELLDLQTADKSCKNHMDIKTYSHDTDAFGAMAAGHTDAYTTDLPVALYYVKAHGTSIRFAGKAFGSGAFYGIGIPKDNPGLRAAVVRAFAKIHANGEYIRILRKWGLSSTHI